MSLKSVKSKIKSIDKTRQVTKAMEAVAAVKMRKSQAQALSARPYAAGAITVLESIVKSQDLRSHSLMTQRPVKRTLLVVISADRGLAGSYGSTLLKTISKLLVRERLDNTNTDVITIGKKAGEFFSKRNYTEHAHYERWSDKIRFSDIAPLSELIRRLYDEQRVDRVLVVYTNFVSTLRQEVYERVLLPLSAESVREVIDGIVPEKGKFSEMRRREQTDQQLPYIFEPNAEQLINDLIPELFKIQLYHSVLEANASEHSARMIAMKNASDNAKEISRTLKLKFNKVRQAAITKEVSEIVGGMESMKIID